MANKPKYSRKKMAQAIRDARGIKAHAASLMGCNWTTVDDYCNKYESCKRALYEARNAVVDRAESKLFDKMNSGDNWAIGKVLNDMGRERGWGKAKSIEISGPGGGPIPLEWED